jgi:D-beta-D-heptose 7-phosphate kinase / D-beta-D-heptose 1-phosphate adenosyltransferase
VIPNLPPFSQSRVLVVGDVMLDRYWHGDTARISPEAPVPVVRVRQDEVRPGGAANVALGIARLGANVELLGLVGEDEAAQTLRLRMREAGIADTLYAVPGHATITKLRVISKQQQLIRLDFEDVFAPAHAEALSEAYRAAITRADVVVLSDYAKGTLAAAPWLIAVAQHAGKAVIVDPKNADFSRYAGASLITPNWKEFCAAAGDAVDDATLQHHAQRLCAEHQLGAILVTRGERGMALVRPDKPLLAWEAEAREVYDVTGAGDTVIAVLAAALAVGAKMVDAARLANTAAGVAVARLGTAAVTLAELQQALAQRHAEQRGWVDEETLLQIVARARARGEKLVMTNGCFDILHAGHVQYLQQARALGERLIVALNDDDSVRRLKGSTRPVNEVTHRAAVLAALAAVDWVVPFSEDTPARLIARVLPDVLVKGGDYQPAQIAGGDAVRAAGGEVIVLPFLPGISTTQMIVRLSAPA